MKSYIQFFIVFSIFLISIPLLAQDKNDFNWILGYPPNNENHYFGGDHISFKNGNPEVKYFETPVDLWVPTSISDDNGELAFYSNGCKIINKGHEIIENGDGLNEGFFANYYCIQNNVGYPSYNGVLTLPFPGHKGQYYLFHIRRLELGLLGPFDLLYTIIDMKANNGQGKVTEKNIITQNSATIPKSISAVRHGNGRDYWIMTGGSLSGTYYTFLLDPSGVHAYPPQSPDSSWIPGQESAFMGQFSPDGTKFVRSGENYPPAFRIYDFDRCSGILSNSRTIAVPDTMNYATWLCFSPDSRYLYLTNHATRLYQYDTEASDIENSVQFIDEYDGFLSIYNLGTSFFTMTIGPDQRIYMSCNNGSNVFHTIHRPNETGTACDFRQHDFEMPATSLFYLPNMPNYRLYQMKNSPCDTLGVQPPMVAFWRSQSDSTLGILTREFTDISYYQPVSWHWDFGDGTSSSEKELFHTFPAPAVYNVCLITCNAEGICDTLCREVDLQTSDAGSIPVPPDAITGIYPNPAINEIWVTHGPGDRQLFILYDQLGKEIYRRSLSDRSEVEQVVLRNCAPGWYVWTVVADQRKVGEGKLVLLPVRR